MTVEVTYIDEIPEGDGPYQRGLWAEARHWVERCLAVFGEPAQLAAVGLTRRLALRYRKWLWCIEGAVRRLIIAAALVIDPASLARATPRPSQPGAMPEHAARRERGAAFRIFSIGGRRDPDASSPEAARPQPPPQPHRHVPFPADDLLAIGKADARTGRRRSASPRRLNPLDRRGRASRCDPDYCEDPGDAQDDWQSFSLFGPRTRDHDAAAIPPRREPGHRDTTSPYGFPSGLPEWRRIDEEWARVIPAPDLGARIAALCRVIENPARSITRLARLIERRRKLAQRLAAIPAPVLRKPRRDPTPDPPCQDLLARSHAALPRPDTS